MMTSEASPPSNPIVRTALVTGSAAARVGRRVLEALAARGYAVIVHAQTSTTAGEALVARLAQAGSPSLLVRGDVRNESTVRSWIDEIVARFGRLDVLVNSAAIWRRKPLEDVTADDVREHFDVNTLGTFLTCKYGGLQMTRQTEGGAIVNLGDWATRRPYEDYAAYFPSKGAVPTLTRMFAVELARRNPRVRVNAVLPGPVMLPPDLPETERRRAVAGTLLKREGSPDHVAQAVLSLVDNEFVTGVSLPVDGGRTIAA